MCVHVIEPESELQFFLVTSNPQALEMHWLNQTSWDEKS